jgi:hypothetical protein
LRARFDLDLKAMGPKPPEKGWESNQLLFWKSVWHALV